MDITAKADAEIRAVMQTCHESRAKLSQSYQPSSGCEIGANFFFDPTKDVVLSDVFATQIKGPNTALEKSPAFTRSIQTLAFTAEGIKSHPRMSVPTPVVLTQPEMLILRVCDFLIAVQFFPVLETIIIVYENWDEEFAKS